MSLCGSTELTRPEPNRVAAAHRVEDIRPQGKQAKGSATYGSEFNFSSFISVAKCLNKEFNIYSEFILLFIYICDSFFICFNLG